MPVLNSTRRRKIVYTAFREFVDFNTQLSYALIEFKAKIIRNATNAKLNVANLKQQSKK